MSRLGFRVFTAQRQAQLFGVSVLQIHQDHTSLGVFVSLNVDVQNDRVGRLCDVRAIAAG
jgi:hypothetical protein